MDQAQNLRNIIKQNTQPHEKLARVITVTSGKGGVGKTSTSVNLAIQLSRQGKKVLILDADFGLANIEVMLGIRPKYTLADVMLRGRSLHEVITIGPENIGFLSGGSGINELANLNRDQVGTFISQLDLLDQIADVIIIDTGAGISDAVMEFVAASSEVILITTPEPTSITDAYALLKTLNRRGNFNQKTTTIKMIGNRVERRDEGMELFQKLSVVVKKFLGIELQLLGLIPYDDKCQKAIMRQSPVSLEFPNSPSSKAFKDIAYVLNDSDEGMKLHGPKGIRALFSNVIRMRIQR